MILGEVGEALYIILSALVAAGVPPANVQICSRYPPSHELWRGKRLPLQFRREGIDDFFEARIAAEWVPIGMKLQLAVVYFTRVLGRDP